MLILEALFVESPVGFRILLLPKHSSHTKKRSSSINLETRVGAAGTNPYPSTTASYMLLCLIEAKLTVRDPLVAAAPSY